MFNEYKQKMIDSMSKTKEYLVQIEKDVLSSKFDYKFKNKYYKYKLTMDDLVDLNDAQIGELENKNIQMHFEGLSLSIVDTLGLKKTIDLYKHSKEDLGIVESFLRNYKYQFGTDEATFQKVVENLKNAQTSEMKQLCYDNVRNTIFESEFMNINPQIYPQKFIDENDDIFLINAEISDELRYKYYEKKLTIDDVIENLDLFSNIPVEKFMEYGSIRFFAEKLGTGGLQYVLKNHRDVFDHLRFEDHFYIFNARFQERNSIEESFSDTIKKYFCSYYGISGITEFYDENGMINYTLPDWLSSLNFNDVVYSFANVDDLKKYNSKTLLMNLNQLEVIETFGIENLIQFDNSTHFFSHDNQDGVTNFGIMDPLGNFLSELANTKSITIPSRNNMTYSEFTDVLAQCLDAMRKKEYFKDGFEYDFIDGEFREKYSSIFMDQNAPNELKNAFYKNQIDGDFLHQHKEYIPFLVNKNLKNTIEGRFVLYCHNFANAQQTESLVEKVNFVEYYSKLYGNENLLNLIATYGNLGTNLSYELLDLDADKEGIEKQYRENIYKNIVKNPKLSYQHLLGVNSFTTEHPDLFLSMEDLSKISEDIRDDFMKNFYDGDLRFEYFRRYPELKDVFKNKNLKRAFGNYALNGITGQNNSVHSTELEFIDVLGQDKFLELCSKYGYYLEDIYADLPIIMKNGKFFESNSNEKEVDYNTLCSKIEDVIAEKCLVGKKVYNFEAPEFLKQKMPNLFLSPDAPQELQKLFYSFNKSGLSFDDIAYNKEWLEYLKDKSVSTSFLKNSKYSYDDMKQYFKMFGEEKGLKIGLQRTETVEKMISSHQVELMKKWYDKTGQKFIPDVVVMENFDISEADKFLASGQNWSTLMKIKSFSKVYYSRTAMLKLAYCFGAFDHDQVGMKKLQELLTGIPKYYKTDDMIKLRKMEQEIKKYNKMLVENPDNRSTMPPGTLDYGYLMKELENSGIEFTSEDIFSEIFNIKSDMSATLKLNPQNCPKAMAYLHNLLVENNIVLSWLEAYHLFGEFSLKYDKDFRDFLLKNFDEIRSNPEYTKYISSVQKQFDSIKAFNSNRALTLERAISFVQSNKYMNVNVGNDMVAEISAIANYSQDDFNILQQIYNYGKTRTFSSIPRIEKSTDKYTYEMLRLDDPLAMAIGTLTDCCQEIGNCAEVCMEHSMVDKNGRVFMIKDNQGNMVAQSWVWRNKDVLCFDNIEIPDRAFDRALKNNPESGKKGLTDEVFGIYKQAAHELIEADDAMYKELLTNGKITQEQYDGLRLGKVTVGLGYNDIADSLKSNSTKDIGDISRPLPFEEPVKLEKSLYTQDSTIQYVLEEREGRKNYVGDTLPVHTDKVVEYTNATFDEKKLLMLEKLELVTKHNSGYMNTFLEENDDKKNIVSSLANNYDLNPETTRIVMNPNFAIIYDVNYNNMKIGDLLYNFSVDNGKQQMDITDDVLLQMKLALEQLSAEKQIDISELSEEQLEVYNKLGILDKEINIRKGVSHGK